MRFLPGNLYPLTKRGLYARQLEVYAGFISHTDAEVGRLIDAIHWAPDGENTLILYTVGDNGAAGGILDFPTDVMQEQLRLIDESWERNDSI